MLIAIIDGKIIEDRYKYPKDQGIMLKGTDLAKRIANRNIEKTLSNRLHDIQEAAFNTSKLIMNVYSLEGGERENSVHA